MASRRPRRPCKAASASLHIVTALSVAPALAWGFAASGRAPASLGSSSRSCKTLAALDPVFRRKASSGGAASLVCTLAGERQGRLASPGEAAAAPFRPEDGISPLLSAIAPSKTIEVHALTKEMEARGEKVISLCVGEPDFAPPEEVIAATGAAALQGRTKYTGVTGDARLRAAICQDLAKRKGVDYSPSEIVVSNGAKQSVYQAVLAVVRPGDEVIIPAPYWPSYPEIVRMAGGTPIIVPTTVEEGYLLSPEALAAAITLRTRMLIFCNPSNPTGAVHSEELCRALASVITSSPAADKMFVMADEIYERLVYGEASHVCFATLPGMRDRTLLVNGFSKSHAMTGYRIGYLAAPAPVVAAVTTIQGQITSCASAISQEAALAALAAPEDALQKGKEEMQRKRDFVLERLRRIPGVRIATPDGAFYALPDVSAFFGRSAPADRRPAAAGAAAVVTEIAGAFGTAATTGRGASITAVATATVAVAAVVGDAATSPAVVIKDADALCLHLLKQHGVALVSGSGFGCPTAVRISYATSMADLEAAMGEIESCLLSLR